MRSKGLGKYYVFAFRAAADITATIAIPALLAAIVGTWLDTHFGTKKMFFIVLLVLAAILTVWGVTRKVRTYGKAYTKLVDEHGDSSARS